MAKPTKADEAQREESLALLRGNLLPGDTLYTVLRTVSKSGMTRIIDVARVTVDREPSIESIGFHVARITRSPFDRNKWGVKVGGCGQDMGFALVYDLAYYLWPDGFTCTGEQCPSNDHSNGDRVYTPHLHKSGAYALRHRWL